MSQGTIELTSEEREAVNNIRKEFAVKTAEIGQTELSLILMKEQKDRLVKEYEEIRTKESNFFINLEQKHGKGVIDIEKGIYLTSDSKD